MCKEAKGRHVLGRKGAVVMEANQAGRSAGCHGHDSCWWAVEHAGKTPEDGQPLNKWWPCEEYFI